MAPIYRAPRYNIYNPYPDRYYIAFLIDQPNSIRIDNDTDYEKLRLKFHNETGPALLYYRHNKLVAETWMRHGVKTRRDGPAIIFKDQVNEHLNNYKEWWLNGAHYTNVKSYLYHNEYLTEAEKLKILLEYS